MALMLCCLSKSLISFAKSLRASTSSEDSGSSSSNNFGFANKALASTTLCASPPDNVVTFRLAKHSNLPIQANHLLVLPA